MNNHNHHQFAILLFVLISCPTMNNKLNVVSIHCGFNNKWQFVFAPIWACHWTWSYMKVNIIFGYLRAHKMARLQLEHNSTRLIHRNLLWGVVFVYINACNSSKTSPPHEHVTILTGPPQTYGRIWSWLESYKTFLCSPFIVYHRVLSVWFIFGRFRYLDYTASGRADDWTGKDLVCGGPSYHRGTIPALTCRSWGKPRNICQDIRCPGRDSNCTPGEYNSRALPIC